MSDELNIPHRDDDTGLALPRRPGSQRLDDFADFSQPSDDVNVPEIDGFDPFYALRILHKWRWLLATLFVLIVVGTAVHTYNIVPVYEARARILVEPERINI